MIMKKLFLLITHTLMLAVGFVAGIYLLPILTQPPGPAEQQLGAVAAKAMFTGQFKRDLAGSDALHYGDGTLYVSDDAISFDGVLAPGPDYRLYLSPVFVETKEAFLANKAKMIQVGDVRTFNDFLLELPEGISPADYTTAIVWCEAFSMFITAGQYQ
jgi:hypothetical protein